MATLSTMVHLMTNLSVLRSLAPVSSPTRALFLAGSLGVMLALAAGCASPPPPPVPPAAAPPGPSVTALPLASAAPTGTPDAAFRDHPPAAGPERPFTPPKISDFRLANGIRVLFTEQHQLPVVSVNVVAVHGGEETEPGMASFAASMILRGSKSMDALQISDAFEALGASYSTNASHDALSISGKVLRPKLQELLRLMAEVFEHPTFPKAEVERERSKRLTSLQQERDSQGALTQRAMDALLYPSKHTYHSPMIGDETSVKAVNSQKLMEFHRTHVTPDRVTLTVAGDITEEEIKALLDAPFGAWKAPKGPKVVEPVAPPSNPKAPRVVLVDKKGATQASVAVTCLGVSRETKDFEALMVLNHILGGAFTSRVNLRLREDLGITYGAFSQFSMEHGPGPFAVRGEIVAPKTQVAVREILGIITKIRNEEVTEAELADAKSELIHRLPAFFQTPSDISWALANLAIYNLPLDDYAHRAERYAQVTREDVLRVAKKYLDPDAMKIVVVGDPAVVKPQLEELTLGPVEEHPLESGTKSETPEQER